MMKITGTTDPRSVLRGDTRCLEEISEISAAALARCTVMADYPNPQTVQEAKARIKGHIASLERATLWLLPTKL